MVGQFLRQVRAAGDEAHAQRGRQRLGEAAEVKRALQPIQRRQPRRRGGAREESEESEEVLRREMAMGADKGIRLTDTAFDGSDGRGLAAILKAHPMIEELRVPMMSVPCCGGLGYIATQALKKAGREGSVKLRTWTVSLQGQVTEDHLR